jgi:SAM-dependent methyltransferase
VELGCGDGRVNFYAIDHGKVKKSIGIDVDEGILKQARARLAKRYPPPPIEFLTADLLDFHNPRVWNEILPQATILTMYFVQDALRKLRPILEEKLAGRTCKILTVAYPMPGWNHTTFETTLGTTCYLYHWGASDDMEQVDSIFAEDSLLVEKPKELLKDPLEQMRAQGLDTDNIEQIAKTIHDRAQEDRKHYWDEEEENEEEQKEAVPSEKR